MFQKLGRIVEKYRNLPNGEKVLMEKLKAVLTHEVENLLRLNGMTEPPFDPFKIHEVQKIPIKIEHRQGIGSHGTLAIVNNEFMIRLEGGLFENRDKFKTNYRVRSTMAHELMHTLFYDTSRVPPRKFGVALPARGHLLMEEELCYFLARQFLVPTFSIKEETIKRRLLRYPSINSLKVLKSTYKVSSDMIAYRLIKDLNLWNAIFIKFAIEGHSYKAITRLKAKENRFYDKLRTPRIIPSSVHTDWEKRLFDHISKVQEKIGKKELVEVAGKKAILDSIYDSKNPPSIMTLLYESKETTSALNKFF